MSKRVPTWASHLFNIMAQAAKKKRQAAKTGKRTKKGGKQ